MTKVLRRILTALAAISVLLLGSALPAAAQTILNTREPFVTNINDECTGETIHLEGSIHQLINQTTDAKGGFHLVSTTTLVGLKGTTDSGVRYVANLALPFTNQANFAKGAAYEATSVNAIVLVSQGSGDNLTLEYVSRITFDANGNIATVQNIFRSECVG